MRIGGRLHLKLNILPEPIANKYREGKVKSTLERGLKYPEIVFVEVRAVWLLIHLRRLRL